MAKATVNWAKVVSFVKDSLCNETKSQIVEHLKGLGHMRDFKGTDDSYILNFYARQPLDSLLWQSNITRGELAIYAERRLLVIPDMCKMAKHALVKNIMKFWYDEKAIEVKRAKRMQIIGGARNTLPFENVQITPPPPVVETPPPPYRGRPTTGAGHGTLRVPSLPQYRPIRPGRPILPKVDPPRMPESTQVRQPVVQRPPIVRPGPPVNQRGDRSPLFSPVYGTRPLSNTSTPERKTRQRKQAEPVQKVPIAREARVAAQKAIAEVQAREKREEAELKKQKEELIRAQKRAFEAAQEQRQKEASEARKRPRQQADMETAVRRGMMQVTNTTQVRPNPNVTVTPMQAPSMQSMQSTWGDVAMLHEHYLRVFQNVGTSQPASEAAQLRRTGLYPLEPGRQDMERAFSREPNFEFLQPIPQGQLPMQNFAMQNPQFASNQQRSVPPTRPLHINIPGGDRMHQPGGTLLATSTPRGDQSLMGRPESQTPIVARKTQPPLVSAMTENRDQIVPVLQRQDTLNTPTHTELTGEPTDQGQIDVVSCEDSRPIVRMVRRETLNELTGEIQVVETPESPPELSIMETISQPQINQTAFDSLMAEQTGVLRNPAGMTGVFDMSQVAISDVRSEPRSGKDDIEEDLEDVIEVVREVADQTKEEMKACSVDLPRVELRPPKADEDSSSKTSKRKRKGPGRPSRPREAKQ